MFKIRPCAPEDLDDLYHISLMTGASGQDATALYRDPKLVGHIYSAPYAIFSPECAFVAEDDDGVGGYIVGALETPAFEAVLEERWWPSLRPLYPDPSGTPFESWSADQLRSWQIHHPRLTPKRVAEPFPSHLHINLLPRLQGQGIGRQLIERWLAIARGLGSSGVHLGVNPDNRAAMRFYRAGGWREPVLEKPRPKSVVWFAMTL
jgi:ribosomal protein S18 acetylase RimI-like enzyme